MDYEGPRPWDDSVQCAACGASLLPMSHLTAPQEDPPGEEQTNLKCSRCGQRYGWVGPGWEPIATA